MLKILTAYLGGVAGAYLLGSLLATQVILANVQALGMDVNLEVRLQSTVHDMLGLATSYLPLIAIAFLIAMLARGGLLRLFPGHALLLSVLAGAVAIVTLHVTMKAVLGLSGIAATRSLAGLLGQGLAGAFGGYLYYRIRCRTSGVAPGSS